jgi:uncharacterized protein YbjT (DUF2867 family)
VIISSMGADPETPGDETFAVYQRAKGQADADLVASGLAYTIVRPGGLTDEPGIGTVTLGEHVERGEIPRADVAAVVAAVLHAPATAGRTFELVSGQTPIEDAIEMLVSG